MCFKKGDIILLRKKIDNNWYHGESGGKHGVFPLTYVQVCYQGNVLLHCKFVAFIIFIYMQGVSEINGTTPRAFCMHRHSKTNYCKNGCMDLSFLSYVPGKT